MFGIIYFPSFIIFDLSEANIASQAIYIYLLFIVMKYLLHVFS